MAETGRDEGHRKHEPSVNQGVMTDGLNTAEHASLVHQRSHTSVGGTDAPLCSWGERISECVGTLGRISVDYFLHCDWKHFHKKAMNPVVWLMWIVAGFVNLVCSLVPLVWVVVAPLILRNSDLLTGTASLNKDYFHGKVFWITGGASGIGFTIARHLSVLGVKGIIILDRSLEMLDKARKDIVAFAKGKGVVISEDDIFLIPLDLSRGLRPDLSDDEKSHDEKWKAAVARGISWRGGVDVLINNAAYWSFGGSNAYTTSKAALYSFTNLLRQDLRGNGFRGVKVTSIHPGVVKTPLYTNFLDSRVDEKNRPQPIPTMREELNVPSLDVEEAVALMIRAISQEQEEVWVAPTSQLMWVYFQYYCPQLRRFSHNVFARAECENLTRVKHDLVRDLKKRSGA